MHGYHHQAWRTDKFSEFMGLSYSDQYDKLSAGKALLNSLGLSVSLFTPPWDTYDETTVRALQKLNFRMLSAARGGPGRHGAR